MKNVFTGLNFDLDDYIKLQEIGGVIDYQYFKSLQNRELILNSPIDEDIVEKFMFPIMQWNREDDENKIPISARKPIKLYISSVGGVVPLGLGLMDIIQKSKTPVYGIVLTYAYSMGFLILLACHKKIGYPFSSYLLHDGSMLLSNSTSKVKNFMEYQDEQEEMMKEFILKHSNISEEEYEKNYTKEWFMTSKKALELGVIDEIADRIV